MVGTNSDIRIDTFATTAGSIFLSVALMGHSLEVPQREYPMPKIENFLSDSLRSLNQNYAVQTPVVKSEIFSDFIGKITLNTKDLEPEVMAAVNQHFWDLF